MITSIAFDGNGVLYHRKTDFTDALMEYIRSTYVSGFDVKAGAEAQLRHMKAAFDGTIDKNEAMVRFLDEAGIRDQAARRAIIGKELEFSRAISLFPTEKETLLELERRGFVLGMITNSYQSAAEKSSWFRALGLDCIADRVVSSIDAGYSKPDRGIYLEFARRAGAAPEQIAFVGHEEHELKGAEEANMFAISFNCEPPVRRAFHLALFSDLLDMFPHPGCTPSHA